MSRFDQFMERHGWVRRQRYEDVTATLSYQIEQRNKAQAQRDKAIAFIQNGLGECTQLEPERQFAMPRPIRAWLEDRHDLAADIVTGKRRDVVLRVAVPAVFDFWHHRQDFALIDDAIGYIADAAAHQIAQTLRFGLTGGKQ